MAVDNTLNKLQKIVDAFDEDSLTKADFEQAFKKVMDVVVKIIDKQES